MVKYENGDVLDFKTDIVAHGCNCRGGFGSGVAGQIARRFPKAKQYYLDKYDEDGWELGDVQFVTIYGGRYIANCATQDEYYPRDRVHVDYEAFRTCMETVKSFAQGQNLTVSMPKIGAGLAGGDWSKLEKILQEVFNDYDVTVYTL